ncbi:MAG: tetratricopeptide repeat protein, partial [Cyanobacteria bacterium J06592_8]
MSSPEELFKQGQDYLDQGEYLLAYEKFHQLVELKPNRPKFWSCCRFKKLHDLQSVQKTIKDSSKVLEFNCSCYLDWKNWYSQGISFLELEQYEKAIDCFEKALKVNAYSYAALCNKGLALFHVERYEESIKLYDKALKI